MTTPTYFWSGTNNAGEIKALAKAGRAIGVAVDALDKGGRAMRAICSTSSSIVFVDSGAFSEVELNDFVTRGERKGELRHPHALPFSFVTVKPITDDQWAERMSGPYTRIAKAIGARAYLVAPDKVGDQAETLRRLRKFAPVVRELRAHGANIIVAVQKGELAQADFDRACADALGFGDYVRGIPSKKNAATSTEIGAFVAELTAGTRIHLLGLGPWAAHYDATIAAIEANGDVVIFCDSVRIRALVGRTNGPAKGPRIYTQLQDEARELYGLPTADTKLATADSARVKFRALSWLFERGLAGSFA